MSSTRGGTHGSTRGRRGVSLVAGALVATLAGGAAAQGRDWDAVEIRTTHVAGPVHMIQGSGGNLAVSAGGDDVFLVDDQFAPLTPRITAAIRAIHDAPVRFVLNTHWHPDHTGGNENLGEAGAVIVAHGNVRERLASEQVQILLGDRSVPPSPDAALPVITFTRDVTFHLNGESVHVFHLPRAHTDGDSAVHFRGSDVLHVGDVLFNGAYPFIDLDSGGSVEGYLAAQERLLEVAGPETKIVPGHGPLGSRDDLRAAHAMLEEVRDRVRGAQTTGQSLEEFLAEDRLADLDERWGGGFLDARRFATILWMDLAR